jgi:hypothetical protein
MRLAIAVAATMLSGSAALPLARAAGPTGAELSQTIREMSLDPAACYRVRELNFNKEDLKIYLTDGYLIFTKPVLGQRLAAVFTAEVEGGDAEILVVPPSRSERQSLAAFTQSPTLDEHLRAALLFSTDGIVEQLLERIQKEEVGRPAPELGNLLAEKWSSTVSNVASSVEMRLVQDTLMNPAARKGLFFMAVQGKRLGNFDILAESRFIPRMEIRQRAERDQQSVLDLWTSFPMRSVRSGPGGAARKPQEQAFSIPDYKIDALIGQDLNLSVHTSAKVRVGANSTRVFTMQIAKAMQVSGVKIDGKPAELMRENSTRADVASSGEEAVILVIAPEELAAGSEHQFEFEHSGKVIASAGEGVYFVRARGSWYPYLPSGMSTFDLTFRYPRRLTLVTAGDIVDEQTEGDVRMTRRRIGVPISAAGFNLGDYDKVSGTSAGVAIEVYGNKHLVDALKPRVAETFPIPGASQNGLPPFARGRGLQLPRMADPPIAQPLPPDPLARLKDVAADLNSAVEYFTSLFGPPALKTLTVAPIPGTFGQGFPGLIYLSTFAYIDPQQRPAALRSANEEVFFSDLIAAHEAAHQWWGGVVTIDRREDRWILEALANYSALLWMEKKHGWKDSQKVLDGYRNQLLAKNERQPDPNVERTRESVGPLVWGDRLEDAGGLNADRAITYGKGAWVFHMLRRRMGDEAFLKMLAELRRRFEFKPVTTEDLQVLAREFRPAKVNADSIDNFFENWVYATGIPTLKLQAKTSGVAPNATVSGTLSQSDVDDDFSVEIPVEMQFGRGTPQVMWVRSSNDGEMFSTPVKQVPTRIVLPDDVLARRP